MTPLHAFLAGVGGAFVQYIVLYRESRWLSAIREPRYGWRILTFDLFAYLAGGGLVALFLANATGKEAFLAGYGWQATVGGALTGAELRKLRKKTSR